MGHQYENFSVLGASVHADNTDLPASLFGVSKAEFAPLPDDKALVTLHSGFLDADFLAYVHGTEVQEDGTSTRS